MNTATKYRPLAQAKPTTPTREGDLILITIPNYWGKGKTFAEAKQRLVEAGGRVKGTPWRVHSVHPSTTLNGVGGIIHPTGHAPEVLDECDPE